MFVWLNKQGVMSEEGFTFQFTGRFTAEYKEGAKKATIEVEDLFNGGVHCIAISEDAFNKWDDGEGIPIIAKEKLLLNVKAALAFQGLDLVVSSR